MERKVNFSRKLKRQTESLVLFLYNIKERLSRKSKIVIKNIVKGLIAAFILIPIATSVIQYDKIPSNSMEGTLQKNDGVFTFKLYYGISIYPFVSKLTGKTIVFNKPKRGDIVLIKNPARKDSVIKNFFSYVLFFASLGMFKENNEDRYLIKRVIALPGETVEIKNKDIYINGIFLNENWHKINSDIRVLDGSIVNRDNYGPYVVPYNEYFTLSDNRDYAYDGRNYGSIPFSLIKGKALVKEKI